MSLKRPLSTCCIFSFGLLLSCKPPDKPLVTRGHTFAELRSIKRGVQVALPGEAARAPYPRERLVDGEDVTIAEGGLAWLRRDGGATMLIAGPAKITVHAKSIELSEGKMFVDTLSGVTADVKAKNSELHLADVKASLDVSKDGKVSAYVLRGELRTEQGAQAGPGEALSIDGAGKAEKHAEAAWEDWTGGLATTEQDPAKTPYGVGTVGARPAGSLGEPRFSLTIQRLDVRVKIDHDFAVTEVEEVFFNPSANQVEGLFAFRTPEGASLHRFGVDRGGQMVWGRVKEKAAAAAQYQSNVYAGSEEDPALLEWDSPGVYKARLYPIAPGGTRRVVTRYAEWLGRQGPNGERRMYVFPMAAEGSPASLPRIEELSVSLDLEKAGASEVRVGMDGIEEAKHVIVRSFDLVPRADLAVELFDGGTKDAVAYRAPHALEPDMIPEDEREKALADAKGEADYLLVPVRASKANEPAGGLDLVIVVDTSAATEPSAMAIARAATQAILAHLGKDDRASVWAGDASLRPVAEGSDRMEALDDARRLALAAGLSRASRGGATDLGAILSEAASKLDPARRGAVVYVGDGRATVGELSLGELRQRLARMAKPSRMFALGVGGDADMGILSGLARGGFAERVTDRGSASRAALRLLEAAERPVWMGASADLGAGIERVFPHDLGALAVDETALVIGRVVGTPPKELSIRGSGGEVKMPVVTLSLDDDGDLRRRWADGRLVQLLDEGAGRAAVVEIGHRYGVVTPFTSLYVPTTREVSEERRKTDKAFAQAEDEERSSDKKEGGTGTRAKGEEGTMGNPSSKSANTRYGVKGPGDNDGSGAPGALREASEFGMIGLLNAGAAGDQPPSGAPQPSRPMETSTSPASPRAPSGGKQAEASTTTPGQEAQSVWGRDIADSFGTGGLGLSGIGEGGGGRGEGTGVGTIGSLAHDAGPATGGGFGSGKGRLGGDHMTRAPSVKLGDFSGSTLLPKEVLTRIVRQNVGRFRLCYENGLRTNPNLAGRVTVRFSIDPSGAVSTVGNGGSDLPDPSVISCTVRSFSGLSFPQPDSAMTTSVPILFATEGTRDKSAPAMVNASFERPIGLGGVDHTIKRCGAGADLPLEDRVILWSERLSKVRGNVSGVHGVYATALWSCEAPTWRERSRLLTMLVDAIPTVRGRVELWRSFGGDGTTADVIYRTTTGRVHTAAELRELHDALGLKQVDKDLLEKVLSDAKTPADRARKLRDLTSKWPDDLDLAVRLLDAFEDAGDIAGGRELARALRKRDDGGAKVRTAVGEYYLRLAAHGGTPADESEARRTFGEIVEFSPDDPVARRRLGDLFRAHGWYEDAFRQYETLAHLSPDDATVPLLLAAAAQGMGKIEEAIGWTEKSTLASAPDGASGSARVARAFAAAFLSWARDDAHKAGRKDEEDRLRERAARLTGADAAANVTRVVLTWSHPELHPSMWWGAGGAVMPASISDPQLGISEADLPSGRPGTIELRLEPDDAARAARLGATAMLTMLVNEGKEGEKIVRVPVSFSDPNKVTRRFQVNGSEIGEGS